MGKIINPSKPSVPAVPAASPQSVATTPQTPAPSTAPEVMQANTNTQLQETKLAKKRGFGSTVLAGNNPNDSSNIGRKMLLGA